MKASVAVWVLLCCCMTETQGRGDLVRQEDTSTEGSPDWRPEDTTPATVFSQQVTEPDIHTVLREMSVKIAQQEVELRCTKTKVEDMQTRLRDSEIKAEAMESRLRASERTVEEQRAIIKEVRETQEEQTAVLGAVGDGLNLTGSHVEELRREREESRVSFSASLTSTGIVTIRPYSGNIPILVYKHVFSNIGNAYNPHTGIFTAPVRGMYHFVFFVHGYGHASTTTGVSLHKNGEHITNAYSHQPSHRVNPSNGVSLLLEVGDVVYLKQLDGAWVADSYNHHSTFSGHLLFPL